MNEEQPERDPERRLSAIAGWGNPLQEAQHLRTRAQKRNHIVKRLDNHGFDWRVVFVAGSGFFTDSFNLFSVNVTLPILARLYWNDDMSEQTDTLISCLTLAGSIVGQILFGVLADILGRQRLYGAELLVVLIATVGIVEASQGLDGWMSIQTQICFWRFVMGVGIGAEYPISSVITAEWAATGYRGRMMAAVFFAQPLGQFFAALVGYWVLLGQDNTSDVSLDKVWRIVSSVGAIPAAIAIGFRFAITDPGRWTLDVLNDGERAVEDTDDHVRSSANTSRTSLTEQSGASEEEQAEVHNIGDDDEPLPKQFSKEDLIHYFIREGNWRYLVGTSICWCLLDIAFFGLGMNNPKTLATIWEEPYDTGDIRKDLNRSAFRSLITVSIGSILGTLALILVIDRFSRRKLLIYSFLALAILFVVTGISFEAARHHRSHILTIVLCGICQLVFNFGPNTLTFIIPAEIFATRYRGTCHGIAAASGKLGSIVIQLVLFGAQHWIIGLQNRGLGYLLLVFAGIMASGALFAWIWVPEVQMTVTEGERTALKNKKLEDLAKGNQSARRGGEVIILRKLKGRLRNMFAHREINHSDHASHQRTAPPTSIFNQSG